MIKDKFKTLLHVIRMRSIISYNGLVYALKMTPVIGRIIPDSLYGTTVLKLLFGLVYACKELFLMFIGKFLGLGFIYLISFILATEYTEFDMGTGLGKASLFGNFALMFFIIYALFGAIFNIPVFRCTTEKEYLVFMLRTDARKLDNTLFMYDLAKLFTGYLIVGFIAAIAGAPLWTWLGIPVLSIFIKFFGAGYQAFTYKIKHKRGRAMTAGKVFTTVALGVAILIFPATAILVIDGMFIPTRYLFIASAVLMLLGVWGLKELDSFDTDHHKRALRDNIVKTDIREQKEEETTKHFKNITATGSVSDGRKGFDFLNALFVRRHRNILYVRPVAITLLIVAVVALFILSFIGEYKQQFGSAETSRMVLHNLLNMVLLKRYEDPLLPYDEESVISFFRYLAQKHLLAMIVPIAAGDISFRATQAMYINCDNSLMTFSFFKRRDKIMELFDIRLRQLIKINAIPSVTCALAANIFLFYTGGQDYPLQYLVTILIALLICSVNSMTGLALYYLFQPFTKTVNVKSGAYMIVVGLELFIGSIIIWIPVQSLILLGILGIYTCLYIYFLRRLISRHAPKSWRIKA